MTKSRELGEDRPVETPLELQETQLTRLASCLNAVPDLRSEYRYQALPVEVYSGMDSDLIPTDTEIHRWRSRGGGFVFWGKPSLDSYCQQQYTMALSSAEAELHEIVHGTAPGLFVRNVLQSKGVAAQE